MNNEVVKFLKELSGRLWKLSKELDELSRDIENFIETYEDAYGEDGERIDWNIGEEDKVRAGVIKEVAKCALCGNEFKVYDLFCLNSFRGATAECVEGGCILLCESCFERVKESFRRLREEGDER